jgi:RNA polymerase sigma-32 factor
MQHRDMVTSQDAYMMWIMRTPLLSQAEETTLAMAYHHHHDTQAAGKLVLANMRFVVKIAHHYKRYGMVFYDLIQEGVIGLMKAIKRFDPTKGIRLVAFAVRWVKAEMRDFIMRNWRQVRLPNTKVHRQLFFNWHRIMSDTISHTSERTHATVTPSQQDKVNVQHYLEHQDVNLSEFSNQDWLAALPDASHDQSCIQKHIMHAVNTMDTRTASIVTERWLTDQPLTLQMLSKKWDVSVERIRQIEKKGLQYLKEKLTIALDIYPS